MVMILCSIIPYESGSGWAVVALRKLDAVTTYTNSTWTFDFQHHMFTLPNGVVKVFDTMPEARDRLSRQDDVVAAYSRRRVSRSGGRNIIGRGSPIIFVVEDENEGGQVAGTPIRWRDAAMVGTPGRMGLERSNDGIGRTEIGRTAPITGRENLSPVVGSGGGRGRGRGSALPIWYPRRPLNDITAVVRMFLSIGNRKKKKAREDIQTDGPSVRTSGDISIISPYPTIKTRRCPPTIGKVPKILLGITHHNDGEDSDCLTPQKKLLNNIDMVEKVVMEELNKLRRTPLAKREEQKKRVRTLMSMR
ncbi:hypothetical protein DH2020_038941 [Rehmannia glutinosa]|uniref:Uncharacterized protein n=1 Tax=Rehmannia glutinosa TaxID=99300 RepID=A0ABR0UXG4_REHGL